MLVIGMECWRQGVLVTISVSNEDGKVMNGVFSCNEMCVMVEACAMSVDRCVL